MLIVGSVAAIHHHRVALGRPDPKDVDVFAPGGSEPGLDRFWHPALDGTRLDRDGFATIDELYTIKVSHAFWDLGGDSWFKHQSDAMALKAAGAKLDFDLFTILKGIWMEKHGRPKVDLTKDADAFFSDAVKRTFVHDTVHESVAYGDRPLYEQFLKGEVDMDMPAVWAAPFETQIDLFREEIYATALERWVIPSGYRFSPMRAYQYAVRKTVVSLTRGRSARFIAENYDVFRKPDFDYVAHHIENAHRLQLIQGD